MIDTETSVVFSGQWITVNTAVIELSIPRDSLAIVGDIVAGLRSLSGLSGVEGSSVNEALLLLAGVNSKLVQGKYITEEMIQDILKAIGRLNKITTIDMAAIRNDTDTLLSVMEGQWYKEYRP